MKDTKHTPGPWAVHGLTVCETTHENRDGSIGRGFVAACYDPDVEDFALDDELFAQAEANAKIIARAPELQADNDWLREVNAELVRAASRLLTGLAGKSNGDCEWYEGLTADAEDELATAIAKANQH